MNPQINSLNNSTYQTTELKLAALILASIPEATFAIYKQPNFTRQTIEITYSSDNNDLLAKLERDFIDKRAKVNVYAYNKALNLIRDRLRGRNNYGNGAL